jgi:hypothetical protein
VLLFSSYAGLSPLIHRQLQQHGDQAGIPRADGVGIEASSQTVQIEVELATGA